MLQAKFAIPVKTFRAFPVRLLRLLSLAVVLGSAASPLQAFGGEAPGRTLVFPTSIQWNRLSGVSLYRLQIGGDETFRDIVYDRRVTGCGYTVSDLPPGYYYWRIAPADNQLGAFSRPVRFFVSGGVVTPSPVRSNDPAGDLSSNTRPKAVLQILPASAIAFPGFEPRPLIRRSSGDFNYVGG